MTIRFRGHRRVYLSLSVLTVLYLGFAPKAAAQQLVYYEPQTGYREVVTSANASKFASGPVDQVVGSPTRGGNLTFNITYNDMTVGFMDPVDGATRRNTLTQVLSYINSVLNATSGATLDITVNTSQTDGTGFLATAGTLYFQNVGFSSGLAQQHISSGTDPSPQNFDIQVTVDFGYTWNSDTGPPAGNEVDLFTVLLHEITHGLGFASLTKANGDSAITNSNPGKYGILAQLTRKDDGGAVGTGSSTALWQLVAGQATFTGAAADLTSDRLVFTGANAVAAYGSNPTIYSPNPYAPGSSLSHWGTNFIGVAVMPYSISPGVSIREYLPFEIGALKDIGYPNAGAPTDPLDPNNVYVDFSYTGAESGAQNNPFNTLGEAVSAAKSSANIFMEPGSSAETFSGGGAIGKALTLKNNNPGGGSVLVGPAGARSVTGSQTGFISKSN